MTEFIKKFNPLIFLLSLVISVVLWGYVSIYQNPDGSKLVTDIPVRYTNKDKLTARGLMLVGGDDETVSVRFAGRMLDFANLNRDTLEAVVDLSSIYDKGDKNLEYELRGPATQLASLRQDKITSFVSASVDTVVRKNVDMVLEFTGEAEESYFLEKEIFDPVRVYISGPSRIVDTVEKAVVEFEAYQISRTFEGLMDYVLFTYNGTAVTPSDMEWLTLETETVWLTIPVSMEKRVWLDFRFEDGGGATRENVKCEITPPSILVAGDPDVLDTFNNIYLGTVGLASFDGEKTDTYQIVLPNDVKSLDGVTEAQAVLSIVGVETRQFTVTNITVKEPNLPEGYTYTRTTVQVTLTLRGPQSDLDRVMQHNVRVAVDFGEEELAPGIHRQTVTAAVDGFETVGVVDKGYEVAIEVVPETDGEEEP